MAHPLEGMTAAAKAGNPQALAMLAHAQALGHHTPRDTDLALDTLTRAAAIGMPQAIRELQLLARGPNSDAKTMRAAVDVEALRQAPNKQNLCDAPRLRLFEGFATADECGWLIDRGRDRLRPARVYENSETAMQENRGRTNTEADFEFDRSDLVLSLIHDRIAQATGVPVDHFEVAKLLHYSPGEAFMRHTDFLKPGAGMQHEIDARGQRVATFLLYLNDDYDAGETEFFGPRLKFKARRGDGLLFLNVDAKGEPDAMSMHAGQPTTRGEKWVLSLWLRGKSVNAFQTPNLAPTTLPPEWYREA